MRTEYTPLQAEYDPLFREIDRYVLYGPDVLPRRHPMMPAGGRRDWVPARRPTEPAGGALSDPAFARRVAKVLRDVG